MSKWVYFFGVFLSASELILFFLHKSICSAYSCKLVASYVKYGESTILFIGTMVFSLLTLLDISHLKNKDSLIDCVLISAFSVEGLLIAFQIFSLRVICYFCFSIFLLFALSIIFRLKNKHYSVLYAIAGFISVFFVGYLILPMLTPFKENYNLFYLKNCPHCEKTIEFLKSSNVKVNLYNAQENKAFLNSADINQVPVLFINVGDKKEFIIGQENIENYFKEKKSNHYDLLNGTQTCVIDGNCKQ